MMSVFVIPLLLPLILIDYSVLLPSTMYGLSGLLQARREGRISAKTLVIFGICSFSSVWTWSARCGCTHPRASGRRKTGHVLTRREITAGAGSAW